MGPLTQWTWVWVNSRSWLRPGRPGVLQFIRSQKVWHDWVTELKWTELLTQALCQINLLFELGTKILIKTLKSGGQSLWPFWEGPYQVIFFFSHSCQGARNWFMSASWPKLGDVILCLHSLCFYLFTSQTELIIYVGLLILTPKILSLPFNSQDNAFLSCVHSYTTFHNQSNFWICRALHLLINWRLPMVGFSALRKGLSWTLQWHLTILRWTGITYCTLTMDVTWLLILIMF